MITLNLQQPSEKRSNGLTLNNPQVPLSSPLAWEVLSSGGGLSDAAELVTPYTSMAQASVNSCVRLLSESIAAFPLILSEESGAGKLEAFSNPLHDILALEPNPESSAFTMWSSFVSSILVWGNGYLEIQRDGTGSVLGLYFLPPQTVIPSRQGDGSLVYKVSQGMQPGQFRLLKPNQVVHVPGGYSVDGVTGISVIAQARHALGGAIAMDKFGNRFFSAFAMPQLALLTKAKMKPEDKMKARTDWENLQSGVNQHRTAILDGDMEIKQLSIPNSDAQYLESRKLSREEICGMFGIKTSQISDSSRVAGETYSQQQLSFLTDTLNPWLQKIRQELTRKLLKGLPQYEIRHDVSDRLKLDVKSQMDAFAVARQWGLMTANQCRKVLGLDPGPPECDTYWAPVNMMDAKRLLNPPTPTQVEGTESV